MAAISAAVAVLQDLVLVRQDLHRLLVGEEILEVIQDEDANALFGIGDAFQPRTQALDDGRKGVLLNQVEQLFLGFEVVVQPGQRHAAGAREVAHGRALVALLVEHIGRVRQDFRKPLVKAASRRAISATAGDGGWSRPGMERQQAYLSNVRSNYS